MDSSNKIKYNKGKILGEGGTAFVFEGTYGELKVAVKRVQSICNNNREFTLHKLDHPNVVKLYDCREKKHFM